MGIFHLGGSNGGGGPVFAANVSFDNDASGLDATDVQAAVDEVVAEKLDVPGFVIWENTDWVTLISGAGAPTAATGGDGWFYLDTTSGSEELYGPATFNPALLPTGVWDWGSPLANFVFSATGPSDEAGDWYVWDENGDGSVYTLFQKKTAINYGDMLFWDGSEWEARSQKIDASDVYSDLSVVNTEYGVDSVSTQLRNLYFNSAYAYNGGNHYYMEQSISGTHEINPFDGNAHILTLTGNVDISFTANWDPNSQIGTRFAELTVVLIQDNIGGHTVTWDAAVKWHGNEDDVHTSPDDVGIWKFVSWDYGTTWYGHLWAKTYS